MVHCVELSSQFFKTRTFFNDNVSFNRSDKINDTIQWNESSNKFTLFIALGGLECHNLNFLSVAM